MADSDAAATMTDQMQQQAHARDVWLHDYANRTYLSRVSEARARELDPDRYVRPFPGTTNNVTYQVQKSPTSGGMGKIAQLAAAAALGAGTLAAGALGGGLLGGDQQPSATASADADAGARVRVFWGDKEITPGQSADSGELNITPEGGAAP